MESASKAISTVCSRQAVTEKPRWPPLGDMVDPEPGLRIDPPGAAFRMTGVLAG